MSNQFGLILSFLFLTIFVSFTKEIFQYQSFSIIFDHQAIQITQEIQKNGYHEDVINEYTTQYQFLSYQHELIIEGYYEHHTLTFYKKYQSTSWNEIFDKTISRTYEIFRRG